MNFLNNDFMTSNESKGTSAHDLHEYYLSTAKVPTLSISTEGDHDSGSPDYEVADEQGKAGPLGTLFWNTSVLSERSLKNYSRNLLAYGVRAGMYGGAWLYVRLDRKSC
jgi:hypothetical protein